MIDCFAITEKINDNPQKQFFRAIDQDNINVIIKTIKPSYANQNTIALFKKEYKILSIIDSEFVIKPLRFNISNEIPTIVMEDFGGTSLTEIIRSNPFFASSVELEKKLELAILTARALLDIHNRNIIHKDINPSSILVNQQTNQLKVINFDLASQLSFERFEPKNLNQIEGTLEFISPEQTGRMNRNIDYHTDLYSLGVTYYMLFTGTLPFQATSPREWVYCHIAQKPISPSEINKLIPATLSAIIMKLLEKNTENRYQSCFGLIHDLEKCLGQLRVKGSVDDFTIGEKDISQKFQLPQKLYGREQETQRILNCFYDVSLANTIYVQIKGQPGMGKSSLVGELSKKVTEHNGYFITGKFDQIKHDIPYFAIIQALQQLVGFIVSDSEAELTRWREKILKQMLGNTKLIVDMIPELEHIVGWHADPPELSATETQNRFIIAFQQFIKIFATNEHPLVLFLDDMQWADSSSLELVKNLLINSSDCYLLIVGSLRSSEVDENHQIIRDFELVNKAGIKTEVIEIKPLEPAHTRKLVAETFSCSEEQARELAEICDKKTHGNPFFINKLLTNFHQNGLISFDLVRGRWTWDIEKLNLASIPENIADIIALRIKDFSDETQNVLKLASCIGSRFDLEMLTVVTELPRNKVIACLNEALEESIIQPVSENYRYAEFSSNIKLSYKFIHDKVQQITYSLLNDHIKSITHVKIGWLLLNNMTDKDVEENVFAITGHLNKGLDLIKGKELLHIASLNLMASRKAKSSGAFISALNYVSNALGLVSDNCWKTDYDFAYLLHKEAIEVFYLCGKFEMMEQFIEKTRPRVQEKRHKVEIAEIRIQANIARHRQHEAVSEALEILSMYDVHFPKSPSILHVIRGIIGCKLGFDMIKPEKLQGLKHIEDPDKITVMRILAQILSASYYTNPMFFPLIVFKLLEITREYGIGPKTPVGFVAYGLVNGALGSPKKSYLYGKLGITIASTFTSKENWAQASCIYNTGVRPWFEPIKEITASLLEDSKIALEYGDLEYGVVSAASCFSYSFHSGEDITELYASTERYRRSFTQFNQQVSISQYDILLQTFTHFTESVSSPEVLIGEKFDEAATMAQFEAAKDDTSMLNVYLNKLMLALYFERTAEGLLIIEAGRKKVQATAGIMLYAFFHFYEAMLLAASTDPHNPRKYHVNRIKKTRNLLSKWKKNCEVNFSGKLFLVEAEIARIEGYNIKAIELYDKAISFASAQGYKHEEALACERAGKLWLVRGKDEYASLYLKKAVKAYESWGAKAKAKQLQNQFESIIGLSTYYSSQPDLTSINTPSTTAPSSLSIDLETIMDAAKTISSEIVLNELIKKIVKIILEHAGAQRGVLLLKEKANDQLYVKAEGNIERGKIIVKVLSEEVSPETIPATLIRYVARTQQNLILNNASNDGLFVKDSYISQKKIKSVLAITIMHYGKLTGIMYLENNLASGAFAPSRLNVLNLLCTQAGISLENAHLYNTLEQKVLERTSKVIRQKDIIERKNRDLLANITYARRIQMAMLPPETKLKATINDYFLLYRPQGIVSGDFYWMNSFGNKQVIAIADCTGHGVYGAFMSLLGISYLKETIYESGINSPALILENLRIKVKKSFMQFVDFHETSDGIDISICIIDKITSKMMFSGAFIPALVVRRKETDYQKFETIVLHPDKMPIGFHPKEKNSFTNQEIQLKADDTLYMFTDGFADQFGGPRKKKFSKNKLLDLLLSVQELPMNEQKIALEKAFVTWKGHTEQIDDVLVFGMRL